MNGICGREAVVDRLVFRECAVEAGFNSGPSVGGGGGELDMDCAVDTTVK